MLKYLKNKKAQVVAGEYVVTFFLGVAILTAMTVYFQRALQGRMYDARESMFNVVEQRTEGYFDGNMQKEYEPYYTETDSRIESNTYSKVNLLPGGETGIFRKEVDDTTVIRSVSETAPPKDAN